MLFDSIGRSDLGLARFGESAFSYLNRSARPEIVGVRETLEAWFSHYPEVAHGDLRGRFRSDERRHHVGAFFELYCSTILRGQGFKYESLLEPNTNNDAAPDFRVSTAGGDFYLEATLVAEADEKARQVRLTNQFHDELNKISSPNFFLALYIDKYAVRPFSTVPIRKALESELSCLDPVDVSRRCRNDFSSLPSWRFDEGGGQFMFMAVPKKPEACGKKGVRPIGAVSHPAEWSNLRKPVVDKLHMKSRKYGDLDLPFVIAINCLDIFVNESDVAEALFGRDEYAPDFFEALGRRHNDVFWAGANHQRVSAVLVGHCVLSSQIKSSTPVLWHNPFAARPLPRTIWKGPQVVIDVSERRIERVAGMTGNDMLNAEASTTR